MNLVYSWIIWLPLAHNYWRFSNQTISSDILIKGFGNNKNILNGKPYELSPRDLKFLRCSQQAIPSRKYLQNYLSA